MGLWIASVLVACGGSGSGGDVRSVSGTITLPDNVSNRCVMIAIDSDSTGSNGVAKSAAGAPLARFVVASGKTVSFAIDDIPAGSYYLWAFVDADGSATSPPADCMPRGGPGAGDHLGYFGGTPSASVNVPHRGGSFDFALSVVP